MTLQFLPLPPLYGASAFIFPFHILYMFLTQDCYFFVGQTVTLFPIIRR